MAITASMVKELRERTGAGMMECKKALVEADGDLDAAAEALRTAGAAKADKKAGRVAADGRVVVKADGNKAVIVEVNSETDFVAKDENFIAFAEAVASAALAAGQTDVAALADTDIGDGRTVEAARTELVQKVGENISVRRAQIVQADGVMAFYTHGARIGAIVALQGGDEGLARDIAMHVAAINPVCIDESGVPAATLETEKRIFTEQAEASGKPPEIIEKIGHGPRCQVPQGDYAGGPAVRQGSGRDRGQAAQRCRCVGRVLCPIRGWRRHREEGRQLRRRSHGPGPGRQLT